MIASNVSYRIDSAKRLDCPDCPRCRAKRTDGIHRLVRDRQRYAFRHGALTAPAGRVDIRWSIYEAGNGSWLTWDDRAQRRARSAKSKQGFGFELLMHGLPEMLGARTSIQFRPGRLRFVLDMPLREPSGDAP
jgi:two-component system CheB/CheR fusion protein